MAANQIHEDEDLIIVDEEDFSQSSHEAGMELASTTYIRAGLDSVPEHRRPEYDPAGYRSHPGGALSSPRRQSFMAYSGTNGRVLSTEDPGSWSEGHTDSRQASSYPNPHGFPEGVHEVPVPLGVELPPGAILGSNHMVYQDGIPIGMLVEDDAPQGHQPYRPHPDVVEVRRIEPPPGVVLPPGTMLGSDGNIYNAERQVVGRLHQHGAVEEYHEEDAPGPGPGPGHHRVKLPPGLQLPRGATLWSDDNVYRSGHVIGRVHKSLAGEYVFDSGTKKITKITPPPGIAIPRGTFLGDDNNIYNNDGTYRGTLEELAKGGYHNVVRKVTCEGVLCAIVCFPCGIICCQDWQDHKCTKCGRIIPALD